jgi:YlmC/YmxH family sporulation protein
MMCSLGEMRRKEVIDLKTGERLGYIDDIEVDIASGKAERFIIYGGDRLFGILGKEDDIVIKCSDIRVVGREVILVERTDGTVSTMSTKNNE